MLLMRKGRATYRGGMTDHGREICRDDGCFDDRENHGDEGIWKIKYQVKAIGLGNILKELLSATSHLNLP